MTGPTIQTLYCVKQWMRCGICAADGKRVYPMAPMSAIVQHYRDYHTDDFVSLGAFRNQTTAWRNDWIRANKDGPSITYGQLVRTSSVPNWMNKLLS